MVIAERIGTTGATVLAGKGRTVEISQQAPTAIIGERCNALGYRSVMRAVRTGRFSVLAERARAQEVAGAALVNCNVVGSDIDEPQALAAAVKAMSAAVQIPLSLDVATPEALLAALPHCPGRPLVNSINGTEQRLQAFVPILQQYRLPAVVMLAEDDGGTPAEPEARFRLAEQLADRLAHAGIALHDLIFDPVILAAALDPGATMATLETARLIRDRLGANVLLTDPTIPSLRRAVLAADALTGRDEYGQQYLQAFRAGMLSDPPAEVSLVPATPGIPEVAP